MALQVVLSGLVARTNGLTSHGLPELEVSVKDASLLPDAQRILFNMGEALQQGEIHLHPGETVQCGYWIVKFDAKSPDLLIASEPNAENTEFVPGADLALTYRRDQKRVCGEQDASFDPPNPLSLIACSDGVLEGRSPVGGTRYRYTDKMSGWFLSTDLYDGTNSTVKLHHAYHVTAARPELVQYLALPPGYRFDSGGGGRAWFDPELEAEEPWLSSLLRTRTFDKEPGALRRALLPGAEGPLDRSIVHLAFRIARGAALALLALLSVVFVEDAFAATRDPDTYIAVYQLDATAPAWSSRGLARYVFDSFLLGCACLVAAWVVGRSLPESAASRRLVVASNVLSLGLFAILAAVLVYGRLGGFDH